MEYVMHAAVTVFTSGSLIALFAVVENLCRNYLARNK
jgi:hypothetical protein